MKVVKKLLLLLSCFGCVWNSMYIQAMLLEDSIVSKIEDMEGVVEISGETYKKIQNMQRDKLFLYYYFKGAFQQLVIPGNKLKPSDFFDQFLQKSLTVIYQTEYNSARDCLLNIVKIRDKYHALDVAFQEVKQGQKNLKWFNNYFKNEILHKALLDHMKDILKKDVAWINVAKSGIPLMKDFPFQDKILRINLSGVFEEEE